MRKAANPLTYWTPGWPLGFSGDSVANAYGNFPSFDTRDSRGFGATRYNFGNGFFVGSSRTRALRHERHRYECGVWQFRFGLQRGLAVRLQLQGRKRHARVDLCRL